MISTVFGDTCVEIRGLSTDKKPKDKKKIKNGSIFLEMDTCKVFMFDEDNSR